MTTPTIIVAERGQQWLAALRTCWRRTRSRGIALAWLHMSPTEVATALVAAPAAVVVLETSLESAASDVQQLDQLRISFPATCLIAALDRRLDAHCSHELAPALMEAGAAHVLTLLRRTVEVLPLIERHFDAVEASSPHGPQSWHRRAAAGWALLTIDLPAGWASITKP